MQISFSPNQTTNNACRTGCTLDAADRRIRTALPDGSAWEYAYDDLGQLTSAQRDSINAMAYAYDTIGNRQTATEDAVSTAYTANDLNQYTAVNSEIPTYDADGNLLTNAGCTYTWNAENRLIRAENGPLKVEANYDYQGRRFEKKVFYGATLTQHQYFIYDGYKLAAITDALDENKITTTFTWQPTGPDTPQTMTYKGETGYYLTDGNKNVLKVLRSDGTELATYTYSPFGQTLSATGPWANINPFRFSSEYHDTETNLIYYNYRYYSPELGRWLSRDPIGEEEGVNLYGIVRNNPVNYFDYLGLKAYCGKDVTNALNNMLKYIENLYASGAIGDNILFSNMFHPMNGWEVKELFFEGEQYTSPRDFQFTSKHGSCEPCDRTVVVNGKCYKVWAVNYILWGKLMQLRNRKSLIPTDPTLLPALYRLLNYDPSEIEDRDLGTRSRIAFTRVGFNSTTEMPDFDSFTTTYTKPYGTRFPIPGRGFGNEITFNQIYDSAYAQCEIDESDIWQGEFSMRFRTGPSSEREFAPGKMPIDYDEPHVELDWRTTMLWRLLTGEILPETPFFPIGKQGLFWK